MTVLTRKNRDRSLRILHLLKHKKAQQGGPSLEEIKKKTSAELGEDVGPPPKSPEPAAEPVPQSEPQPQEPAPQATVQPAQPTQQPAPSSGAEQMQEALKQEQEAIKEQQEIEKRLEEERRRKIEEAKREHEEKRKELKEQWQKETNTAKKKELREKLQSMPQEPTGKINKINQEIASRKKEANEESKKKINDLGAKRKGIASKISGLGGGPGRSGGGFSGGSSGGEGFWHRGRIRSALANTWNAGFLGKGIIILVVLAIIIGIPGTALGSPLAWGIAKSVGSIKTGSGEQSAKEAAYESQGFFSKVASDFRATYTKSIQEATGQSIEGKVEEERRFVGIELKEPYLPNPRQVNQDEHLEMSARVHGFHPKREMEVTVVCHLKPKNVKQWFSWKEVTGANKAGGAVELDAGFKQEVNPSSIKGDNFEEEITCYPELNSCGDATISLTAEAEGLTTDSVLNNYIIDGQYLEDELKEYAKSKDLELGNYGAVQSAMRDLHPEIGDYRSISEKGPVNLFMITEKSSLIGVDTGERKTQLRLKVALENALEGLINSVDSVTVVYPDSLTPVPQYCKKWKIEGDRITLGKEYFEGKEFLDVRRGVQKPMPGCDFEYTGPVDEIIGTAKRITFLGNVRYNYIVQKQNLVSIRDKDGNICKTNRATSTTKSTSTSGTSTKKKINPREEAISKKEVSDEKGFDSQKYNTIFYETVNEFLGAPGTNLESADFFGTTVQVNQVAASSLKAIESSIEKSCSAGASYFSAGVPITGQTRMQDPSNPSYPDWYFSYGMAIRVNPADNPSGQKGEVETDIPGCVVTAFESNGWVWEGHLLGEKDPSDFIYNSWWVENINRIVKATGEKYDAETKKQN